MEFVGLALVSVAALLAWLVAARPGLLTRIGRKLGQACVDGLFAAAEWYAEPYLDAPVCHASPTGIVVVDADPADPADAAEASATARLLDGRFTKVEYHAAMAELARLDAARRPLTLPPLSDR
jgi:hypothetical protein